MYTPIDDQATIDEKIHKFIESKSQISPWNSFKKTVNKFRLSSGDRKLVGSDISYEVTNFAPDSFKRVSYKKFAS